MSLDNILEEYKEVRIKLDYYKAKENELKEKLKELYRDREDKVTFKDDYIYEYYTQTRKKLKEKDLIKLLEDKGLENRLEYVPKVNEKTILELLEDGELNQDEVKDLIEVKEIECFKFKKNPKGGK